MPRYRVTISGPSEEAMRDLVRKHHIPVFDHGIRRDKRAGYLVGAVLQPEQIKMLQARGYKIQRHEDVDKAGKARQREVGQGNRYLRP